MDYYEGAAEKGKYRSKQQRRQLIGEFQLMAHSLPDPLAVGHCPSHRLVSLIESVVYTVLTPHGPPPVPTPIELLLRLPQPLREVRQRKRSWSTINTIPTGTLMSIPLISVGFSILDRFTSSPEVSHPEQRESAKYLRAIRRRRSISLGWQG